MEPEIIVALIGLASTYFAYKLGRRGFLDEQRFRETQKRRDLLGEFLGTRAKEMQSMLANTQVMNVGELTLAERRKRLEEARELHLIADKLEPSFVGNEKVQTAIRRMGNIVGNNVEVVYPELIQAFQDDMNLLREYHKTLHAQIMGEAKPAKWRFWKR